MDRGSIFNLTPTVNLYDDDKLIAALGASNVRATYDAIHLKGIGAYSWKSFITDYTVCVCVLLAVVPGYDCGAYRPCTQENRDLFKYYFVFRGDDWHYVACGPVNYMCWVMSCGAGTIWGQDVQYCIRAPIGSCLNCRFYRRSKPLDYLHRSLFARAAYYK